MDEPTKTTTMPSTTTSATTVTTTATTIPSQVTWLSPHDSVNNSWYNSNAAWKCDKFNLMDAERIWLNAGKLEMCFLGSWSELSVDERIHHHKSLESYNRTQLIQCFIRLSQSSPSTAVFGGDVYNLPRSENSVLWLVGLFEQRPFGIMVEIRQGPIYLLFDPTFQGSTTPTEISTTDTPNEPAKSVDEKTTTLNMPAATDTPQSLRTWLVKLKSTIVEHILKIDLATLPALSKVCLDRDNDVV